MGKFNFMLDTDEKKNTLLDQNKIYMYWRMKWKWMDSFRGAYKAYVWQSENVWEEPMREDVTEAVAG